MNATEESITAPQQLHDFLWTSASYLGLRPRTGGEAEGLRAASLPAHLRGTPGHASTRDRPPFPR